MPIFQIEHGGQTLEIDSSSAPSATDLDSLLNPKASSPRATQDPGFRGGGAGGSWEPRGQEAVLSAAPEVGVLSRAGTAIRESAPVTFLIGETKNQELRRGQAREELRRIAPGLVDFIDYQKEITPEPTFEKNIVDLPLLPEITKGESDQPLSTVEKVGSVAAGAYNAAAPVVSSFSSPKNIAILLGTAGSGHVIRGLVAGLFGAKMASDVVDEIPAAKEALDNPDASLQEKTQAVASPVITAVMASLAALGAVHELRPELARLVKDKPASEAAKILREEAAKTGDAAQKSTLGDAASKLDDATAIAELNKAGLEIEPPSTEAAAPGPEATKLSAVPGGAEKLAEIQGALKSPDTVIQYSVWDRAMMPEGADRTAQVDLINPKDAQSMGGIASTNRGLLNELGVDAPAAPEWLTPGRYTLDQIKQAIADGPPAETPAVGLGAASPAEFRPAKEFQTSVKNAQMDAEAVARGQEPAMAQAAQKNGETWQQAMRAIDENQNLPDELISELKEKSRPISAVEQLVLGHRNIELQNEFNKAERNIAEGRGTPDSLAADRATQERVLDELMDVRAVTKASGGSEVGRSLQIRRTQVNEDFSLPTMMAERRVARGGAKLTPEEMDAVRKQHAEIEDAQRALDQYEAQQELDAAISTPEEAATQITKLETEVKVAEKSPSPALDRLKNRTQKRIDELRAKIKSGDFSKKVRVAPQLDHEANVLQAKLEEAKGDFNAAIEKDKYDRLSNIQKLRVKAADVYDAARNLMTTGEFSFVLRQGKLVAASHPIMTARALPKAFQALFADETTAHAIDLQTFNHPNAADARAAGLHLVEEGARLSAREESLASTLADKLPVLRNFNQAGRVFLNKLRFDLYETMNRPGFGPEQRAAIAQYANEATGRGSLGSLERAAVPLARVLFAPRYLASRLQYAVGHSLWGGDLATRRIIATEYARTLVGLGVYYTSLNAAFNALADDKTKKPTITFDPRSSDFGKIKMGNTRLDPLAGLSQVIVFGSRTASGEKTNAKGVVVPLRGKVPYGGQKWSDVAATFARSKLHPIPGAIINLFDGTDLAGNKVTPLSQAANMVAPLTYLDIYQALEEQDLPEGVSLSLLALLGEGLQTYKKQKPKKQMGQPTPAKP